MPLPSPADEALKAAVAAIYFDDSSDYSSALWEVVRALSPSMAELLEANPSAAYHQAAALAAVPVAQLVEAGMQKSDTVYLTSASGGDDLLSAPLGLVMRLRNGGQGDLADMAERDARDAARYRWLRDKGLRYANVGLGSDCDGGNVVDFSPTFTIPEPVGMAYEDNEWSLENLDAAIDIAISANKERI